MEPCSVNIQSCVLGVCIAIGMLLGPLPAEAFVGETEMVNQVVQARVCRQRGLILAALQGGGVPMIRPRPHALAEASAELRQGLQATRAFLKHSAPAWRARRIAANTRRAVTSEILREAAMRSTLWRLLTRTEAELRTLAAD